MIISFCSHSCLLCHCWRSLSIERSKERIAENIDCWAVSNKNFWRVSSDWFLIRFSQFSMRRILFTHLHQHVNYFLCTVERKVQLTKQENETRQLDWIPYFTPSCIGRCIHITMHADLDSLITVSIDQNRAQTHRWRPISSTNRIRVLGTTTTTTCLHRLSIHRHRHKITPLFRDLLRTTLYQIRDTALKCVLLTRVTTDQCHPIHWTDFKHLRKTLLPPRKGQYRSTPKKIWEGVTCNWILVKWHRARSTSLSHEWWVSSLVWQWPVFRWQWWAHFMANCVSDAWRDDRV